MRYFAYGNGILSKNQDTAVWQTIHFQCEYHCIETRNSEKLLLFKIQGEKNSSYSSAKTFNWFKK